MNQTKIDAIRSTLEDELAAAERQLQDYGGALEDESVDLEVDEGFADSAAATQERSETLAQVEQTQGHRQELKDALERIERGTYGKCENCGRDIPPERLEALPTARLCVDCKQAEG